MNSNCYFVIEESFNISYPDINFTNIEVYNLANFNYLTKACKFSNKKKIRTAYLKRINKFVELFKILNKALGFNLNTFNLYSDILYKPVLNETSINLKIKKLLDIVHNFIKISYDKGLISNINPIIITIKIDNES